MNAGPMSHHRSPQSLHILRFFFLAFTSTTSNNSQGSKSGMPLDFFFKTSEYPEYLLSVLSGTPRRQSRIPGIPVQSLNFPKSDRIWTGIPDP